MADYISKDKALYFIEHNDKVVHYLQLTAENMVQRTTQAILQVISELPAADVQPVKHSKWGDRATYAAWFEDEKDDTKPDLDSLNFITEVWCESCKRWATKFRDCIEYKYCPHCGARMDGERNDD